MMSSYQSIILKFTKQSRHKIFVGLAKNIKHVKCWSILYLVYPTTKSRVSVDVLVLIICKCCKLPGRQKTRNAATFTDAPPTLNHPLPHVCPWHCPLHKFICPSSSIQPFGGMQREKTVVDVDMSEQQKKALFTALVRDHTRAQLKKDKEQQRHSEAVSKI